MPSAGPSTAGHSRPSVKNTPPNPRPPSPDWSEWDIELDLNPGIDDEIAVREDSDLEPVRKRQKMDNTPTVS